VSSAFWAPIRPETFLKLLAEPERVPTYNSKSVTLIDYVNQSFMAATEECLCLPIQMVTHGLLLCRKNTCLVLRLVRLDCTAYEVMRSHHLRIPFW